MRPPKVEFEFTDLDHTTFVGASILALVAKHFGLFELLGSSENIESVAELAPASTKTICGAAIESVA